MLKKLLTITILMLLANPVYGAIVFDAASSGSALNNTTNTVSHTIDAGADLIMVSVLFDNDASTVSGVTWNTSENLTQVPSALASAGGGAGDCRSDIWYLVNPTTGTANIVVTLTASEDQSVQIHTYSGVDTTAPIGTAGVAGGDSTGPVTVTVTSATDELVFSGACIEDTNSPVEDASMTERTGPTDIGSQDVQSADKPGETSTVMQWTIGGQAQWAISAVPIKPLAAADPATTATSISCIGTCNFVSNVSFQ